jgi:hypothetical protein
MGKFAQDDLCYFELQMDKRDLKKKMRHISSPFVWEIFENELII